MTEVECEAIKNNTGDIFDECKEVRSNMKRAKTVYQTARSSINEMKIELGEKRKLDIKCHYCDNPFSTNNNYRRHLMARRW